MVSSPKVLSPKFTDKSSLSFVTIHGDLPFLTQGDKVFYDLTIVGLFECGFVLKSKSVESTELSGNLSPNLSNFKNSLPQTIRIDLPQKQRVSFNVSFLKYIDSYLYVSIDTQNQLEKDSFATLLAIFRKNQHIDICANQDVESRTTGFANLSFIPQAVPTFNFDQIDLSTLFLGRKFSSPLLITGMTGGVFKGSYINENLAQIAQELNIPMGVGSQRIALEDENFRDIFILKKKFPNLFLIGNIGCSQILKNDGVKLCLDAVSMIEADALAIHLNLIQECVQVEGDRVFKNFLDRLKDICLTLNVPVIVKEVGSGIDPWSALQLKNAGVSAIDVGGRGGTSWGYIEGLRSGDDETKKLGVDFRSWGIPTAYAIKVLRNQLGHDYNLIATGGIRSGLDIAKACALGASMVGIGLPFMKAALDSYQACHALSASLLRGLRITLMATGSQKISELSKKLVYGNPLEKEFLTLMKAKEFEL